MQAVWLSSIESLAAIKILPSNVVSSLKMQSWCTAVSYTRTPAPFEVVSCSAATQECSRSRTPSQPSTLTTTFQLTLSDNYFNYLIFISVWYSLQDFKGEKNYKHFFIKTVVCFFSRTVWKCFLSFKNVAMIFPCD